jgi:LysR family transcriptional regulator, benzoate and cis,cis-muconate-responsive activator of ben and cat genes
MELRHLRYFTAVADHGSFNKAAQVLHLTQPALSRQVKDLEEEVGVPLLVRGPNAVTLTPTGESFYEDARDVLARAAKAIERARGDSGKEMVRVGYIPATVDGIMASALEKFQAENPSVRVELADLLPNEMQEAGLKGQLDVLILPGRESELIDGYQWAELRGMQHALIMPATHPLARLKKISPTRLQDVPLIGLGRENFPGYLPDIRAKLRTFNVTPRFVALINDSIPSLFAAVEAHRAAAVLTDVVKSTMPRSLVMRPFAPALPGTTVMIGISKARPSNHSERLVTLLREESKRFVTAKAPSE